MPSILYSLASGVTDVGAYEFRGSSADVTPPTVTSVTPASVVGGTANQIRIDFSEEPNPIDATATANYQLRDAGPDGVFGTSDDHVYQLTPQFTGSTSYVLLNVAGGALLSRIYQLTVVGSTLHDLSGLQLNGSGTAGSNLVQTGILGLPGVQASPATLSLTQGGAGQTVSIMLASAPTGNVVITLTPDPLLNVSASTLTFTPANWYTPQTVTVTAPISGGNGTQMASVQFSAASVDVRYQGIAIAPVTATITSSAATVSGIIVNGGAAQRSRLTTIQINFTAPVTVAQFAAAGAITLTRTGSLNPGTLVQTGAAGANGLISVTQPGANTSITLTFSNADGSFTSSSVEYGSLSDGYWRLAVPIAGYTSALNDPNLRRLFGDADNSGTVDAGDFGFFGGEFGVTAPNQPFDFDNSGTVDASDFSAFGGRFGVTL
jgi:hypothetical protein